jgi:hemoglobin
MSLYEKLGGEPAIDATVEKFYQLVLADTLLAPFFAKTDMVKQRRMQKSFLNHVLGNKPFAGKTMKAAHKGLGLTDEHFNHVAKHLVDTMLSLGVAQNLVDEVLAIAETTRNDVLGRDAV